MTYEISTGKNRERDERPDFANINLLGRCNAQCFFCLGKDIASLLDKHDQTHVHYEQWKNFEKFLSLCRTQRVTKLYITGQNTDSLLYRYLDELVDYLQGTRGFTVGLRTNGYRAHMWMHTINQCLNSTGYSVHTLHGDTNKLIMRRASVPKWNTIIPATERPRISIVINRYNVAEFNEIMQYLSKFDNIRYVQVRRVSTDTRFHELKLDMQAYENLYERINFKHEMIGTFHGAEVYEIHGMETVFWRTVQTSINSLNYFTDGTISDSYFVVEGYLQNYQSS